jgi:Protein of unknown function (DUF2865)
LLSRQHILHLGEQLGKIGRVAREIAGLQATHDFRTTDAPPAAFHNGRNTAFAYRKALRADCTCNGRSPAGLSPVDLAIDGSLRSDDVVATAGGLIAHSSLPAGNDQAGISRR